MTIHPAIMIAVAFLSGSIPFGLIIGKAKGIDIRKHGSGNIGATNLGRVLGRKYFFLGFTLDMLKGLLPTLAAGRALSRLGEFSMPAQDAWWWLGAMAGAVLGHVFTPWLAFKGGKGVATGLGAMLGVFPVLTVAGVVAFAIWLVVYRAWRYISLASITAGVLLPVIVLFEFVVAERIGRVDERTGVLSTAWPFLVITGAFAALVVWTHRANIKRLMSGTELRAGGGATAPSSGRAS
jgi:glycerol-3-phosphate acyltransferase PlsY